MNKEILDLLLETAQRSAEEARRESQNPECRARIEREFMEIEARAAMHPVRNYDISSLYRHNLL
jgi:hypothetical protein